ncbi:uncharacterized protein LOC105691354 [Athalia rosae]|uniref:uncharacterized protein LOC105691354 n=1 Tax=Athalia rosae TaxID=37344 RepID=UPI002034062C|nr:uncharacterized protein LOC105691354 [Athalia rosae]XP_048514998.1 uncharacterized protein LOC105691354 [Athalia rosae]
MIFQRKKKIDKSKKTAGAVSDKKGEAETGKETAGEKNEKIKDEDEDKGKSEATKPKGRAEKDATKTKTKKNRKQKKSITEDSDSDISIRSIDSEVCAAGLALTKEDKKKIEENRRKVHPPPEKTDASAKADENI